ncbi:hypothetical protein C2S51_014448 [Perilla frutescens var. frutescens]|nr:hypothetical protein C2S51_014448 [Perilla frutescens var. frutescens]
MYNIDIPDQIAEKVSSHRGRRRIRRLPAVLRYEERTKHNYEPKIISFGPFHHGKPSLHLGETFKLKALETFLSTCDNKDKLFFHNTIESNIDEIRRCYDEVSIEEHDDAALAEMMLLDGFFIVSLMELLFNTESLINVLFTIGMAGFSYAVRDMFLLENQIPYLVIKLIIKLRYDDARKGEDLLNNFLNFAAFQGHHNKDGAARDDDENEPLHLLEAIRRKMVSKPRSEGKNVPLGLKVKEEVYIRTRLYTSRSVTDLKAKGIDFKPSPTAFLRDVKFNSHFVFSGDLNLPVRCISEKTKVLFTNLIAYETSPDNVSDYAVSSYVNLMKSLIHTAKDVKELREKRILVSNLGSDEEVFQVLKDIDTCGMENSGIFHEVKERIEEHYNNKTKTWMAELMHTYFDSPWTAIALLAATLLLCLTLLQTYFTIHPSK